MQDLTWVTRKLMAVCEDKDHLRSGRWIQLCVFRQNQEMKQKLHLSNLHTHKKSSLGENIWKMDQSRLRPYETLYLFSSNKSSERYSERFWRNNLTWHFFSVSSRTCIHLFLARNCLKAVKVHNGKWLEKGQMVEKLLDSQHDLKITS